MLKPLKPFLIALVGFVVMDFLMLAVINCSAVGLQMDQAAGNILPSKLDSIRKNHPKQINVLALGTSVTDMGFAPRAFEKEAPLNINSFNMGLSGSRHDVLRDYLRYHIENFGKPKLLIVEVTDVILGYDNYLTNLQRQTLASKDGSYTWEVLRNPVLKFQDKQDYFLTLFNPFLRYRSALSPVSVMYKMLGKGHKNNELSPSTKGQEALLQTETLKGWSPKTEISANMLTSSGIDHEVALMRERHLSKIKQVDFSMLKYLLDYCSDNHLNVVLVEWPSHPRYMATLKQQQIYPDYQKQLHYIAKQYNAPIVTLPVLSERKAAPLYTDGRHMSAKGAEYYSHLLAQKLFSRVAIRQALQPEQISALKDKKKILSQ